MDYKTIIDKIKPEMDKTVDFLDKELAKIRTSGASVSLIEDILVDCFGQKMPLKQLAAISLPESRQIIIQPWDNSYLEAIQSAISKANLGVNPIADKNLIRISFPPLSEEYRQDLIKIISEKKENARKTIRHWREEVWKEIQLKERSGELSEDDKYKGKEKLQKLIDDYNNKIEDKTEKKRKEIEL